MSLDHQIREIHKNLSMSLDHQINEIHKMIVTLRDANIWNTEQIRDLADQIKSLKNELAELKKDKAPNVRPLPAAQPANKVYHVKYDPAKDPRAIPHETLHGYQPPQREDSWEHAAQLRHHGW